ncbi:SHOCT domain-containing protein [Nocardioides sp. STR2]|jgi:putative oligomerization/nucleic acid binding protein/phospholipase D-like protein|uniref:SHOCT domain-containing protein n=1 Tax=Nocardioides pini TaxID=2975053 RepID=A0ABT4CEN3_9ACTN|nr:SHOCT domain-containing protein [Nocardioides pini]MCY4727435.1 SHOCT domain-containing protein [Nocardioides pini]
MSDDFGFWDVIVSIFWFTILLAWISLLIHILADIFRDDTMSGGKKALWTIFIVLIPWLGALVYIISRGDSMNQRSREAAMERMAIYESQRAPAPQVSDELQRLAELRDSGVLSPAEYEQAKAKVLA